MPKIIVPHRDPNKAGATEHVDAIIASLRAKGGDIIIAEAVINEYEGTQAVDLSIKLERLKAQCGADAEFIVVTGDYGADTHSAIEGAAPENVAATFKRILGTDKTRVVLSSYTAESKTILEALKEGEIDQLAVPKHAVQPGVLGEAAKLVIRDNKEKLILMTAVPHILTEESLQAKCVQWNEAVVARKVTPLPIQNPEREMVAIMIPGDVEDASGKPKLFTVAHAERLANAIADQIGDSQPVIMVSNGPRTGKYNEALLDDQSFLANNPAFQNTQRMDSVTENPVAAAFIAKLSERLPGREIILGCIEKGKVPPQGFLAFYDVLNQHAASGGNATYYVDGVSTTMMAQAANVLHPDVQIVACDTPAKNLTHDAGVRDLFEKGHVHQLGLRGEIYVSQTNPKQRIEAERFDDAAIVASKVVELCTGRDRSAVVGRTF